MYGNLPNTGLNFSTPIYALVGLVLLIAGAVTATISKVRERV